VKYSCPEFVAGIRSWILWPDFVAGLKGRWWCLLTGIFMPGGSTRNGRCYRLGGAEKAGMGVRHSSSLSQE